MIENLKPCPICGGDTIFGTSQDKETKVWKAVVSCVDCGLEIMSYYNDLDEALESIEVKWNRRTDASKIVSPPCPFCGGQAEVFVDEKYDLLDMWQYGISCKKCGARIVRNSHFRAQAQSELLKSWGKRIKEEE